MMRNLINCATIAMLGLIINSRESDAQQAQQTQQTQGAVSNNTNLAPFVLTPQEQAVLDQFLTAWEAQSSGTKRLEANFRRWHYDPLAAPAKVHSTWAEGVIKYGAPDKGLFRVDQLKFLTGIPNNTPTYAETPGQFGEHWVCNGEELLEFDRSTKQCKIQKLPPELRGKEIFESPLPFVFNLNAAKIKERYWVRQVEPQPGVMVVEAFPKYQVDRAQYKFVRVVVDTKTFLPRALIMYGPNFDEQTAPAYDHYEFMDIQRNTVAQMVSNWGGGFINERPPATWTVVQEPYRVETQTQLAQPQAIPGRPAPGSTIR